MTGLPDMGSAKFKPDTSRIVGLTIAQLIQETAELVPSLEVSQDFRSIHAFITCNDRQAGHYQRDGAEEQHPTPYAAVDFLALEILMREHVRSLGWEYQITAPSFNGEACDVMLTWVDPTMSVYENGNTEDIIDAHDICAVAFMRAFLRMLPQLEQRAAEDAAGEMEA